MSHTDEWRLMRRVGAFALLFNAIWEFAQCPIFYEMSENVTANLRQMLLATAGDVLVVVILIWIVRLRVGIRLFVQPTRFAWAFLVLVSAIAAVALEWIARY